MTERRYGERQVAKAKHLLSRLKPYEVWLAEAPRSVHEAETAKRLISEIKAMAAGEVVETEARTHLTVSVTHVVR